MFNDGLAAQAAENAISQGVLYTTSAGNHANHGYLADWKGVAATVGGVTGTFQDITGANDPLQTFSLPVGDTIQLSFDWDSAFLEGGGTGNYTVPNDLQVLVTSATGAGPAFMTFNSEGTSTNEAFQFVNFTNNGTFGTNNFAMAFNLVSGPAPTMVRWVSFDDGDPTVAADPGAKMEGAPTTFGHETATGVITTGAVDYTTPTAPEFFTAMGGNIPILFSNTGARLATPDIRVEPIVAAPDGVQTSVPGFFPFFGTSAATPHVAGAAALLMQQAPTATVAEVTQYLEQHALNLNTPDLTGFGLIQLTVPLTVTVSEAPPGPNNTSDTAIDAGTLSSGNTASISNSIGILPDGRNNYTWYRWQAAEAGTFTATETTTTADIGNLETHLFTLEGNTLVELARAITAGVGSQTLSESLASGQAIFVEIKGQDGTFGLMGSGFYNLEVSFT